MTHAETPQRHFIRDGRFVCEEEPTARCRNYPACECEVWDAEQHGHGPGLTPEPGHEDVPQGECWMAPWINGFDLGASYDDDDPYGLVYDIGFTFPDGPVVAEWSGDAEGVLWHFADGTRPVAEEDE